MLKINNKNLCEHCFSEIGEGMDSCPYCTYPKNSEKYPTALSEGTILAGRYIVGRVLGKGGFGVTYLCYDTKDEKRVAVKEYLPDSLSHRNTGETNVFTYDGESEEYFKKGAQNFFEEAKLVSRFNGNPNIISVYEFFYENNTTYFVMEFLEGVDLKTYIKNVDRNLTEEEALFVATNISDALTIVHSMNILHRDISPDNIFICNDSTVKLIDFGAARQILGEASKSLSVILKEGFAPLEQYQTRGKQGPWTDIYALGATLYYGLTGNRLDNAMTRITDDAALDFGNVSPAIAKIINKMVAVRKEDRYQNTFELKKDITALTEVTPPPPPPVPVPVDPWYTKIKENIASAVQKNINPAEKINFDAKTKKRILAILGSVAVVIIAVVIAVAVPDRSNVTESSGGNNSGNDIPTLNGTIDVNQFTEEIKTTSNTEKVKTTKKKVERTTKKPSTTKRKTSSTTNKKTQKYKNNSRNGIVSTGNYHSVALRRDGTVIAKGDTAWADSGQLNVSGWKNIVYVTAGSWTTIGVKSNGTVVATGDNSYGQCDVSGWSDIVAVAAGNWHTVGLKSDGTVVATGKNDGQCSVSGWKNIIEIEAGKDYTVGLKSDGTVVTAGNNTFGQCDVSGWRNIVAIAAGETHTVGLKSDGTVVAVGDDWLTGQCDVSGWRNIIAIAASDDTTVGLKSDGTVVVAGPNYNGESDTSGWKNIVAVAADSNYTIGIKSDGTAVAVGYEGSLEEEADVFGWNNIKNPK